MSTDLWGKQLPPASESVSGSRPSNIKARNRYRLPLATDPPGRTCGKCGNHLVKQYRNKTYHKCSLIGDSNGDATDIRIGRTCDRWTPEVTP